MEKKKSVLPAIAELKDTILLSIILQGKEKAGDLTLKDSDTRFFLICKTTTTQDANQHKKPVFYLLNFQNKI